MVTNLILAKKQKIPAKVLAFIPLSVSLIALSFAAILIRLCEEEISPNATVFNRLWIASLVFIGWIFFNKLAKKSFISKEIKLFPSTKKELFLLILVGILSSTSVICWAWSLTETTVANSTILRNLCPIFTSLGGWLFLNQRFKSRFIFGMIIAILGAMALCWNDLQIGANHLIGDTVALLAAFFYAINLLILEYLRPNYTSTTLLLWRCSVGAFYLLPIVLLSDKPIFPVTWKGWIFVISFALICQVLGQGLLTYSLKNFSSSFITVFLLLEPAITACLAWLFFAESLNLINGCAFIVILSGIYLAKSCKSVAKIESNVNK